MNRYKPRRCSKRWLDADCPAEVLAIIDHGKDALARYDVIYTDVQIVTYGDRYWSEYWLNGFAISENGAGCDHFEMKAHEVAAYRYRFKHRYTTWSSLPDAVKSAVRRDIAEAEKYADEGSTP